ncbi:hypothetical protein HKCCSP123_09890 [Rhodobacterales bacterium HKCCSP123]|nr:hypothetical protein [Rhodobacterales bacterium HKCCSP123]
MDYGYQLLRHVVQQVFGNLRQAARLTLALFLAPFLAFVLLGGGAVTSGQVPAAGSVLGLFLVVVIAVVAYCWAAVAWHRYVLLEEMGDGFLPIWRGDRVAAYFGRAFIVVLVVILAGIGASIALGIVVGITQSTFVAIIFGIGLILGLSWVAARIGLVLPAAAVGERMKIGESWAVTRPVSSQILLPLIVFALVAGVIQQTVLLVFGQTVTVETFGMLQDQRVLTLPGQIVNGLVSWVQVLVNLALMTTLYGNLVEGRQLN